MKKSITTILLLCAVTLGLALSACSGGNSGGIVSGSSGSTISGVASLGTTTSGTVSVKDSSVPAREKTAVITSNGSYKINTTGLKTPYVLKAEWTDSSGNNRMYSIAEDNNCTNINQISDTAVIGASENDDADDLYERPDPERYRKTKIKFRDIVNQLRVVLAPLFALYETDKDPVSDELDDDDIGLKALFKDVKIEVKKSMGMVVVTNKRTLSVIFSGPTDNLASGTFFPENMPAGPGSGSNACTYVYSAWGACQSDGTQTRTMLSSSPAGCTGTPILTQTCVSVPPPPAPCTYTYDVWGACQSTNIQIRGLLSSSPAGCVGTPVLSQACTYVPPVTTCNSFTYNAWGACQSNNTQTRTVATSLPAGCTGGSPILSQACTYVPPVTTCNSFTYNAWGACQSNNTQTRTVAASLPAGCTGGSPVLSQACTYVPPTPVCGSCHAIPPQTGKHDFHITSVGLSCSTCHGTGYSSTTVNAATHANGVKNTVATLNFNATTGTCGSPGCHGSRGW